MSSSVLARWEPCGSVLCLLSLDLSFVAAQTQEYPNRPIRMIIPYAPGRVVDVSARIVGKKLGNILGQRIVVETRSGASGMLGASVAAKAPADGYTLLLCPGDVFTIESLKPRADVGTQLLPIAMINSNPMPVVANAKAPFSTAKEMVEAATRLATSGSSKRPGSALSADPRCQG